MDSADVTTILREPGDIRALPSHLIIELRQFFRVRITELLSRDLTQHHPLGFYYAVDLSGEIPLRYHIWPTNWAMPESQVDSEIHDHIFELNSVVLLGGLLHETFDFLPSLTGRQEIVRVRYDGNLARLSRDGEFGELRKVSDDIFREGTAYRLRRGMFHRAQPTNLPTVTLVAAVPNESNEGPRIVIDRNTTELAEFPRPVLEPKEIDLVLTAIAGF